MSVISGLAGRRRQLRSQAICVTFGADLVGLDARQLRSWVHIWLERVRKELGQKPIVYTNVTSWRATGDTTELARAGTPLWIANWGVDSPAVPADDWDGRGWSIWQFTNSGSVRGITGRVDEDWLRGGFGRVSAR